MTDKAISNYPSKQPFPKNRVVSIEENDILNNSLQKKLRTFESHAFQRANSQLDIYLTNLRKEEQDTGICLGIIGEYGSGKTRVISF